MSIAANPGGSTLSGTTTIGAIAGVATFPDLSISKSGTGYTLQAMSGALASATSAAFAVTASGVSASLSAISATPTAITASTGTSAATVTVTARDAFGNPIGGANVVLVASGMGNTVTQSAGTTDASGVATGTLSSTAAEAKVVSATINSVPITETATVTVTAGSVSATQSTLTVSPATIAASSGASAATVTVTAKDVFGNPIQGATVLLAASGTGNTLTQPSVTTNASGVATGALSSTAPGTKAVSATVNTLAINQTATVTVTAAGASASQSGVSAAPTTITASDGASTATITVTARDGFDNPIQGATVVLGATGSGNSLTQPGSTTDANGIALGTLSSTGAGTKVVSATIDGVPVTQTGTVTVVAAAVSGTQSTILAAPAIITASSGSSSATITVTAKDGFGNPVEGASVLVNATGSGNTLTQPGGPTDANGVTTATLSSTAAEFKTVSATISGVAVAQATGVTVEAAGVSASQSAVSAAPTTITASTGSSAATITVTAKDAFGNLIQGVPVVLSATPPAGNTFSQPATTTNGLGVATGTLASTVAETKTVSATIAGTLINATTTVVVNPAAAKLLLFNVQPNSTVATQTIRPATGVQVEVRDTFNNRVTTASNNVGIAILNNAGTPVPGTLAGATPRTPVGGSVTFNDLSIDKVGTGYTLVTSSTGLVSDTSTQFNITVGAATKLGFVQQPTPTSGGATISPPITVEVQDAGGNRVGTASNLIGIAILSNPGGGTLAGDASNNAVSGLATFSSLSIDDAGTDYTLQATAAGLASATSSAFDIMVGGAAKLGFVQQPTEADGGATISPAVTVEIQDAGGNRVTGATNSVTLAIGVNPGPGAALSGINPVSAVNGLTTFSNLSIDSAGTGYTLVATSGGLTQATSNTFDITVGAAAQLGFVQQPTQSSGGATITPAITLAVQDLGGNRVTSATNSVAIAILSGGGSLSGTTPRTAVGGLATFNDLSIDLADNGYTLRATATGLTGVTSNTFNIIVGPPAKLVFLQQPTSAIAGAAITPAITVRLLDAGNNLVTTATNPVDIAILNNAGPGGILSGTTQRNAVSGVATFNNLSIDKTGTGYTLAATSGSMTSATSIGFDITHAAVDAVQSTVLASDDTMGQCLSACLTAANGAVTITVTARDQFGNGVPSATVALSASPASADSNRFTNPGAAGTTDASGVFTASFNSAQALLNKTISATASGVLISQTTTIAVMPVLVGAGDVADCTKASDDSTARLLDSIPGTVFVNGDNAYPNGRDQDYANCYDPTWGRHLARTRPVTGNHEYDSSATAAPYLAYFGAAVADPLNNGGYYYSYDLGAWHIVVLNTDIPIAPQVAWLQADLVGRTNQCILAMWHRAIFTSGSSGGRPSARPLWQALQDAGAEIVINGHDHLYERFALQDSLGNADPTGIREFIVGTGGGETHGNFVNSPPNVEASDIANFSRGVIRLTLYADSYRWEFIPASGFGTFTDSGTEACH
jgi:hypothetical protein